MLVRAFSTHHWVQLFNNASLIYINLRTLSQYENIERASAKGAETFSRGGGTVLRKVDGI